MARLRFMAVALVALAFACSSIRMGRTQQEVYGAGLHATDSKPAADDSRAIYSLTEMGYDADLGKWIAETIPEMIEPRSWGGDKGTIRYYAPKNVLIVRQTQAIQKQVADFLKELKTSMPKGSAASSAGKKAHHAGVVAADYREPGLLRASVQANEPSSYPVPAAVKPPKHLFHFIIRYEGDGIIDDNVVKFMKSQLQGARSPVSVSLPTVTAVPCAPPVPPGVGGIPPLPASYSVPATPYNSPAPSPEQAGAIGAPAASAAPAQGLGTPPPSETPKPPSPTPKKRKDTKKQSELETR